MSGMLAERVFNLWYYYRGYSTPKLLKVSLRRMSIYRINILSLSALISGSFRVLGVYIMQGSWFRTFGRLFGCCVVSGFLIQDLGNPTPQALFHNLRASEEPKLGPTEGAD